MLVKQQHVSLGPKVQSASDEAVVARYWIAPSPLAGPLPAQPAVIVPFVQLWLVIRSTTDYASRFCTL